MERLIEIIGDLFPDSIKIFNSTIETLNNELSNMMEEFNNRINEAYINRDFDTASTYMNCAKEIAMYEVETKKFMRKMEEIMLNYDGELPYDYGDISVSKRIDINKNEHEVYEVNYKEYNLNDNVIGKKIMGFKFLSDDIIEVNDWRQILIKTSEMLLEIDEEKFVGFIDMPHMNGDIRKYFAKNNYNLKKPVKLNERIYIERNITNNEIRNLIIKMLKEYKFKVDEYKVYEKHYML